MIRMEIELTDDEVAKLRRLETMYDRFQIDGQYWLERKVHAALPPEPVRLEIELAPDLFDWISKPGAYGSGMEIGPRAAGVLNAVVAAAAAKRDPESGQ